MNFWPGFGYFGPVILKDNISMTEGSHRNILAQVDRPTGPQGDGASQRQAEGGAENLIWL